MKPQPRHPDMAKVRELYPPVIVNFYFNPPPLLPGETEELFTGMAVQLAQEFKPREWLQWIWVVNVLFHLWEKRRKNNLKVAVFKYSVEARAGVAELRTLSATDESAPAKTKEEPLPLDKIGEALVYCMPFYEKLEILDLANDAALRRLLRDYHQFWGTEQGETAILLGS